MKRRPICADVIRTITEDDEYREKWCEIAYRMDAMLGGEHPKSGYYIEDGDAQPYRERDMIIVGQGWLEANTNYKHLMVEHALRTK